jgi:uncharacterized membrane protein (Fun14 family)
MEDGFFVDVLIGYALKRMIKMVAVIFGLFLAALEYLQQQQIAIINWNKLQTVFEDAITSLSNVVLQIPGFSGSSDGHAPTGSLAMTAFGIPSHNLFYSFIIFHLFYLFNRI